MAREYTAEELGLPSKQKEFTPEELGLTSGKKEYTAAELGLPEPKPTQDTGVLSMMGRGVVRGAKQTGSLLADVLPAMAAKAVGADEYAAKQMEEAAQTQKEIEQKYGARYKSLSDVKGIGDYIPFALETVAEQIPGMATALIPGAGLGVAGGRMAASAAAKKLAEREATEAGARYAAMKTAEGAGRGQLAGTFLGSYALNAPEVFQNIYEETGQMETGAALLAGSVSAALDSVLPVAILKQLGPNAKAGVVEKILEKSGMPSEVARRVVGTTIGSAATEGVTEAGQEAISIAAEKFVQENPEIWGSKEFNRIIESSVRGAVGGGAFGLAGSGAGAYLEGRRERQLQKAGEPGRSAIDEARDYGTKSDAGAGEPGVSLSDEEKLRKSATDAGAGEPSETDLDRANRLAADAAKRDEELNNQLNELDTREAALVSQLNNIKGYIREISEVDPTDERIGGAEQQFGQIDSELQSVRQAKAELAGQGKIKAARAAGQMGLDFNAPEEPPTDQEMQDAGFTQYEIEQLKKNPWPERYRQIKQGYRMIGGQFRQVTQEDVDQVKQSNINRQQIKADKKAQLDAAFAKDPRDGVSQILGSDWNRKFNLSTEEYQKHAYDTLERQYGSIDSGVAMLERRLAAAQSTKPKAEAPEFELAAPAGYVPETKGIEAIPEGERAQMMLIGSADNPLKPLTAFFNSLKSGSANPAQSVSFRNKVNNMLDDVAEFLGFKTGREVARFKAEGKGPDVSAPLAGPELDKRLNFLRQFFDSLSIAPKEREALTSGLSQRFAGMDVKSQSEALASLTSAPNLNTVRGINDFSTQLKEALNKYERASLGIEGTVLPFEATEALNDMEPYTAQQIQRALTILDGIPASQRTPEENAAYAYFGGRNGYPTYSLAMRSAAFDLGIKDNTYSGVVFKDQNKAQATLFKKWVEDNLPAKELKRFDATVAAYQKMVRDADAAIERADKLKKEGGVARKYIQTISRAPTGKAEGFAFDAGLKPYKPPSKTETLDPKLFYPMHPAIQARIEAGDLNGALELLTRESVAGSYNKFITNLARRLKGLNLQTKVVINQQVRLAKELVEYNAKRAKPTFLNTLRTYDWGPDFIKHYKFDQPLDTEEVFRGNLEGLEAIASGRLEYMKDVIPPIIGQFNTVLEAYQDAVSHIDSAGVYYGGYLDTINLNSSKGGMSTWALLHEVTHAGTMYALDPDNFNNLTKQQQDAVTELNKLFEYAKKKYEGKPEFEEYGFKNVDEFVSEAFANEEFQNLLRDLRYEGGKVSLWDKFTRFIAKLFGLDNVLGYTIANANIILQAPPATTANMRAFPARGKSILKGNMPANPNFLNTIDKRFFGRPTWNMLKMGMGDFLENVNDTARKYYLGGFTLRQLNDLAGNRIPQFRTFIAKVEGMLDDRNQRLEKTRKIALRWQKWQKDNPKKAVILNKLMIDVTLDDRPPYTDKQGNLFTLNKDPDKGKTQRREVDEAWEQIGEEGQNIYREVRDFYKQSLADYINNAVENKKAQYRTTADIKDPKYVLETAELENNPEVKRLREHFSKHKVDVYFPIRRFGRFSVQFFDGKQKEFYLFESAAQRNAFLAERKAQLEKDLGRKLTGTEVKARNSIQELAADNMRDFTFLEELKNIIKSGKGETNEALKANIEENLEQLYFLTLPDQSVRKMFMNRKGVAGMELDMLRAFTSSAFHMSYQHSRYKFSRGMFDDLATARQGLKEKDTREGKIDAEYVAELEKRMEYIMNPTDTGGIPGFLSNASFIWFMTSPASALVNMLGVVAVGLPVVGARFGNAKTAAKMSSLAKKFAGAGFKDKEGNVAFPSLNNKAGVLTELQQRAYDKLVVDGLFDITLSHDIVGMAEAPSNLYTGKTQGAMKVLSGLFHGAEKFNREVVGMSVFDLAYDKAKADGYTDQAAFDKAIEVTKELTYKSMFDYSTLNKPRYFQSSYAKVILQFKQFAQQMTYLLARSLYEWQRSILTTEQRKEIAKIDPNDSRLGMYKDIADQIKGSRKLNTPNAAPLTEAELDAAVDQYMKDMQVEARNRLLGTLGLTAVFAGASGLPLWWAVSGVVNAMQAVFGDDEEEWDFDNWFKNWCNETFGGFVGDSISRGVVSQALGADLASRLSLNDMWYRDTRKSSDEVTAVQNMFINLLGPTAGLVINGAEAVKQYNDGYIERAFETGTPAVIKNALKGIRLASEGRATTLKGNELLGDVSGYEAGLQFIGFSPERLAQRQKSNIEMKTAEQNILNRRQSLLDAFFMGVDNNDSDLIEETLETITKFNAANPGVSITGANLSRSVTTRYKQRGLAEITGGMSLNKKLIGQLSAMNDYGDPED